MVARGVACTVCTHADVDQINAMLLGKTTFAKVAVKFSLSKDAVRRHNDNHLGEVLAALKESQRAEAGGDSTSALVRLEELYERTNELLEQAQHAGNGGQVLQAVREARATLESIAKITGELNDKPQLTINLAASPEWMQLQGVLLAALSPFPDARLAVADAIDMFGDAPVVRGELMP